MLKVGLTGGIACGKSEAAKVFRELGIVVIDADQIAKDLLKPQGRLAMEVAALFGAAVTDTHGHLNRKRLRDLVFSSSIARRQLEAKLHPVIFDLIRQQLQYSKAQGHPYAIVMAPLLIETGFAQEMDRILVIDCPESLQMDRLMKRDRESAEKAQQIIKAQLPRPDRLRAADDIVDNGSTPQALRDALLALHQVYLKLTKPGAPARWARLGNESSDC